MELTAELLGFLSLWPLWLFIIAVAAFVFVTRSKTSASQNDLLGQQMEDQRHVNSIANHALSNDP